jgi:hypothetical protein
VAHLQLHPGYSCPAEGSDATTAGRETNISQLQLQLCLRNPGLLDEKYGTGIEWEYNIMIIMIDINNYSEI